MTYEVFYTEESENDLLGLPSKVRAQIKTKVEGLSNWQGDITKLAGIKNSYRLRSGNYRILFERDGSTIVIFKISHRKDAYD